MDWVKKFTLYNKNYGKWIQKISSIIVDMEMAYDRNIYKDMATRKSSYVMSVALGKFGKARREHWRHSTYVYYKGQEVMINFGATGINRPFIPRKDDINAMDWVEYNKEVCSTCITVKDLRLEMIPSSRGLMLAKSAEVMIKHLEEFHPCTCKG